MSKRLNLKKGQSSSSKARAGELLGSVSGSPSFGSFGSGSFGAIVSPPPDVQIDAVLTNILKKLVKKDTTTKLKALSDLQLHLNDISGQQRMDFLAGFWPNSFNKLALDIDRKVRLNAITIHALLCNPESKIDKKIMMQMLKSCISVWLVLQFDTYSDVSKLAKASFEGSFPNKLENVLTFCQSEIMEFVSDNILHQSRESLTDPRYASKEDSLANYNRIISSSFRILSLIISTNLKLDDSLFNAMFDSQKFWDFFAIDEIQVRKSCYQFLNALCEKRPDLLKTRLPLLVPIFATKSFTKPLRPIQSDFWVSLLTLVSTFPVIWDELPNPQKFLSEFYKYIKLADYTPTIVLPCLLPFMASFTPQLVNQNPNTFSDIQSSILKSLSSSTYLSITDQKSENDNNKILIDTYLECWLWRFINSKQTVITQDDGIWIILRMHLFNVEDKVRCDVLAGVLGIFFARIGESRQINDIIFSDFMNSFFEFIQNSLSIQDDKVDYNLFCNRLGDLFSVLADCNKNEFVLNKITETTTKLVSLIISEVTKESLLLPHLILLLSKLKRFSITDKQSIKLFIIGTLPKYKHQQEIISNLVKFTCSFTNAEFIYQILENNKNDLYLLRLFLNNWKFDEFDVVWTVELFERELNDDLIDVICTCFRKGFLSEGARQAAVGIVKQKVSGFIQTKIAGKGNSENVDWFMNLLEKILEIEIDIISDDDEFLFSLIRCEEETKVKDIWIKVEDTLNDDVIARLFTRALDECLLESCGSIEYWLNIIQKLFQLSTNSEQLALIISRHLLTQTILPEPLQRTSLINIISQPQLIYSSFLIESSAPILARQRKYLDIVKMTISDVFTPAKYFGGDIKIKGRALYKLLEIQTDDLTKSLLESFLSFEEVPDSKWKFIDNLIQSLTNDQEETDVWKWFLKMVFKQCVTASNGGYRMRRMELLLYSFTKVFENLVEGNDEQHLIRFEDTTLKEFCDLDLWKDKTSELSMICLSLQSPTKPKSGLFDPIISDAINGVLSLGDPFINEIDVSIMSKFFLLNIFLKSSTICKPDTKLFYKIRAWYSASEMNLINQTLFEKSLHVQIIELLFWMVGTAAEEFFSISSAKFLIEFVGIFILGANTDFQIDNVLLYKATQLYACIVEKSRSNSTVWSFLGSTKNDYDIVLYKLFISLGAVHIDGKEKLGESEEKMLDLLNEIIDAFEEGFYDGEFLDEISLLIYSSHFNVQSTAYRILKRNTINFVHEKSLKIEMNISSSEDSINYSEQFPSYVLNSISHEVPEWDSELEFEELSRHLDITSPTFGYLISWMLLLDHFENATFQLKAYFVSRLRKESSDHLSNVLGLIFNILKVGCSGPCFDLSKWEFDCYEIYGFDEETEVSYPLLAAHVYWRLLNYIPSLVRDWWSSCKNRQLTLAVESFTERYYSSLIIKKEISAISTADQSLFEELKIKTSVRTRAATEVSVSYSISECTLEMIIKLPSTFPLKQVEVESGAEGRVGVTEPRWRAWLLSANAVMVAQNGSIVDAIGIFRKNISMHFEGIEDCAICYSIIGMDRSLPTKECRTCKNKFHGSCLYKWFKTSNKSDCPLCRSLF